jgi:putative hydrolase of the HAD superfamily
VTAPEGLPRAVADHYRDLRDAGYSLHDGTVPLLESLRASGAPLGLVTNGSASDQRAKLERFDLARHFDHIQIEGEFGAGKPDVAVYHAALRALDVAASEATFVGDNPEWDVAAPMRLGMQAVWVDAIGTDFPTSMPAPTRIVRGVGELLEPA